MHGMINVSNGRAFDYCQGKNTTDEDLPVQLFAFGGQGAYWPTEHIAGAMRSQ